MDAFLGDVSKNAQDFWNWVAQGFWAGFLLIPASLLATRWDRFWDASRIAERTQQREHTEWRARYVSGEMTETKPPNSEIDVVLRWFIMRKSGDSKKVLLNNRAQTRATSVRVTADTWKTGKVKRWRKIKSGKTVRLKVGQVPDHNAEGIRLDIHWDDATGLAHSVTFLVPLGEKLPTPILPKPAVALNADGGGSSDAAPVVATNPAPVVATNTAPVVASNTVAETVPATLQDPTTLTDTGVKTGGESSPAAQSRPVDQEPLAENPDATPHDERPQRASRRAEPEQNSSAESPAGLLPEAPQQSSRGAVAGISPSSDIANKSIPNRTPGLPANFTFVYNKDKNSLGLKNEGPGDASKIYLQPYDDDQAIQGGGFWHSIPADGIQPFKLANDRDRGIFKVRLQLSWDDGFELGRAKDMVIPGIGD